MNSRMKLCTALLNVFLRIWISTTTFTWGDLMGTREKAWHAAQDSPEQIAMCLSCDRPRCVDCIGRRLSKNKKRSTAEYKPREEIVLNDTDRSVLQYYGESKSDRDLAEKIGIPRATVSSVRRKLQLPSPRGTTPSERKEIVELFLGKVA